jgi:hypothetical protein
MKGSFFIHSFIHSFIPIGDLFRTTILRHALYLPQGGGAFSLRSFEQCRATTSWLDRKVFVYRGRGFERLPEFQSRILDQFPTAELMTKLSAPTEEEMDQPGQMVQINKVQRKY